MSGPAAERLKDKYASKLSQAEGEAKSLKDKQKELRDTHTTGLSQIDMMGDLVRLLQLKVWMGGRRGLTGGGLLCLIVQVDAFGWIPFSVAPVSIAPCSTMVQVDLQKREMGIAVSPPAPPPARSALSGGGMSRPLGALSSGGGAGAAAAGADGGSRAVQFNTPGGGNVFVL